MTQPHSLAPFFFSGRPVASASKTTQVWHIRLDSISFLVRNVFTLGQPFGVVPAAAPSPVVGLLVTTAELHARADLGVVDAAEHDLTEDVLGGLSAGQRGGIGLSGTGTSGAPVTGQPDEVQTSGRT
ncbi:MAG TPA: hypothetical protein VGH77_18850 [Streptosporangiaceae bacterium]